MTKQWKIYVLGLLMVAVTAGAFANGSMEADADGFYRISGLKGFTGVSNTTAADVVILVGEDYSVRASGERRALDRFVFDTQDGVLRIRRPWRPWWFIGSIRDRDVRVEVSMPGLDSVVLTGSGEARVDGRIRADQLALRTTGSGGISAQGDVDMLDIRMTGSGDIDFDGNCDEAILDLTGAGNLRLQLDTRSVDARITGSGDIDIDGSTGELELRLTGSGRFRGDAFTAGSADVTMLGSGDSTLAVERALTARLTGSGDLQLVGSTPSIDARTTGSGRVIGRE